MALCPFATQRPVEAHGGSILAHLGVVIHVTAGEGDPYNEFANPANQVSSHFGIGNGQGGMADGALEQYVDTDAISWAEMAGNAAYVSVETEGQPTDPLTNAQVVTFARLYAWLHATHNIPFTLTDVPGSQGFITHGDGGVAWGGHTGCPGPLRATQRQTILALARAADPGVTPPQLPAPVVTAYPEDNVKQFEGTLTPALDANGNGWYPSPLGIADVSKIVSIVPVGDVPTTAYPVVFRDWYIAPTKDAVIIEGGVPRGEYAVVITALD